MIKVVVLTFSYLYTRKFYCNESKIITKRIFSINNWDTCKVNRFIVFYFILKLCHLITSYLINILNFLLFHHILFIFLTHVMIFKI